MEEEKKEEEEEERTEELDVEQGDIPAIGIDNEAYQE